MAAAIIFFFFFFPLLVTLTAATDSLPGNQSIIDDGGGASLVSSDGTFEFGFFTPNGSSSTSTTNRYIGIWYKNIPLQTIVWVANRDTPLTASGGVLHLAGDGNLSLRDRRGSLLWSTKTPNVSNPILQLLDSGNLVLTRGGSSSSTYSWQSFDYPSDTLLPGMKSGWDLRIGLDRRLTSWKSTTDPSPGAYTCGIDLSGVPEMIVWEGSSPMYRARSWDGRTWGGAAPFDHAGIITNYFHVQTQDEVYCIYYAANSSVITRLVLGGDGTLRRLVWQSGAGWVVYSYMPKDPCDEYDQCGAYGICSSGGTPICRCMTGFERRPGGGRCGRKKELDCSEGEEFVKVSGVKLPDTTKARIVKSSVGIDQCRDGCSKSCSCMAFAFLNEGSGCIIWVGDLLDVRDFSGGGGEDLYVRLAADPRQGSRRHAHIILIVILSIGIFVLGILLYFLLIRRYKRQGISQVSWERIKFKSSTYISLNLGENEERGMKFSLFHYSTIIKATNNFSEENKLGEGGFGPVYKGLLQDGQEIAVKRLSTYSKQGIEEFENEILLIAKLQHRNLVRILGCCIHKEENMLIYEYMPNKSLDFYIFDSSRRAHLIWHMRFHIIEGIAQGLSYLHKHSRLRIIHRDLKASNILLDGDMNPKISDFGIAKIFGSNASLEKTRRVVGTYGYMAPEYAVEGIFSIKTDVFSFGVVLLEIISGKRNNYIYQEGNSQNLLGYAWALWKEDRWFDLVDFSLDDTSDRSEIYRCIHVAFMCVQENFEDRPTMSEVITMLSSENASLPEPKQPAFFNLRIKTKERLLENVSEIFSLNDVTITTINSR